MIRASVMHKCRNTITRISRGSGKPAAHRHVIGPGHTNEEHRISCMITCFSTEALAKKLGLRIGRVKPISAHQQAKASKLRLLIDEEKFHCCGFEKDSDACKSICEHPYQAVIDEQARTGQLGQIASDLLKKRSTSKRLTVQLHAVQPAAQEAVPRNRLSQFARKWHQERKKRNSSLPQSVMDESLLV